MLFRAPSPVLTPIAMSGAMALAVKFSGTPRAAWTQAWLKYPDA